MNNTLLQSDIQTGLLVTVLVLQNAQSNMREGQDHTP